MHPEKFSLNFSSSSFVIRVNLLHSQPSLFLYVSLISLWCFSILGSYYFKVFCNFWVILYITKIPWQSFFNQSRSFCYVHMYLFVPVIIIWWAALLKIWTENFYKGNWVSAASFCFWDIKKRKRACRESSAWPGYFLSNFEIIMAPTITILDILNLHNSGVQVLFLEVKMSVYTYD